MFSVVLQAYFSTRSSRSLEAGTWPQFSTPLSPVPIPNRRDGSGLGALLPGPPQFAPFNRTRRGCIKILEWANVLHLRVVALKPRLCWGTRHSPGQESHHLSRPHSEAGLACSTRNAGGGQAPGAHSRGDPGPGGQVCATPRSAKAGSRGGHPHQLSLLFLATRCGLAGGEPRGVVVRLPESWPGNPARRKGLPAGA